MQELAFPIPSDDGSLTLDAGVYIRSYVQKAGFNRYKLPVKLVWKPLYSTGEMVWKRKGGCCIKFLSNPYVCHGEPI